MINTPPSHLEGRGQAELREESASTVVLTRTPAEQSRPLEHRPGVPSFSRGTAVTSTSYALG